MSAGPIVIDRRTLLELTPEGERALVSRGNEVSTKVRGVLALFDVAVPLGTILDDAASTRTWMQRCVIQLLEDGLIRIATPTAPQCAPQAVARAKIELLGRLQAIGSFEASLLADDLLHCRTLRGLAERARDIALHLRDTDGVGVSERFWNAAKEILLRWRGGGHASRG